MYHPSPEIAAVSCMYYSKLSPIQSVAFGVRGFDEEIEPFDVLDFHVGGIPLDLLAGPDGQVADEHGFGQGAGVVGEVRHGLLAGLDGADPFFEMTGRMGELHLDGLGTVEELIVEEDALVADGQRAALGRRFTAAEEFLGRELAAVVPDELQGRTGIVGGELIGDDRPFGEAVLVVSRGFGDGRDGGFADRGP